jgi:anti-sigma regulatory factor (Ser/Thr protein kinase)
MPDEMTLEIPAEAAYAVTARLFVVTAARDLGAPDGIVEDLRLAASELVANAVEAGQPGPIRLTVRADQTGIRLDASGVGSLRDEPPISRRALLGTLFDVTDVLDDGAVRLQASWDGRASEGEA